MNGRRLPRKIRTRSTETKKKALQPAKPANSIESPQPNAQAKPDLFLPPDPSSFNLNPSGEGHGEPANVDDPVRPVGFAEPKAASPPNDPLILPPAPGPAASEIVPPPDIDGLKIPIAPTPGAPPAEVELEAPRFEKDPSPIVHEAEFPPYRNIPNFEVKPMPQPGEAKMNSMKSVMAAVVGAALLAAPTNAEDPKDMGKAVEKLDAAVKKLEEVEKTLSGNKNANEATLVHVLDEMKTLKASITQLEADVKMLRQNASTPSTSNRITTDTAPKMGQLKLVNDYIEEMSIVVNGGVSYRLLPGQTRTISVPAGNFTYQILQLQPSVQERSIAANEEKSIRVFTRP